MTDTPDEKVAGGPLGKLAGTVKEVAGDLTGDETLAREGRLQSAQADAEAEAAELERDKADTQAEAERLRAEVDEQEREAAADAQERQGEAERVSDKQTAQE